MPTAGCDPRAREPYGTAAPAAPAPAVSLPRFTEELPVRAAVRVVPGPAVPTTVDDPLRELAAPDRVADDVGVRDPDALGADDGGADEVEDPDDPDDPDELVPADPRATAWSPDDPVPDDPADELDPAELPRGIAWPAAAAGTASAADTANTTSERG